MKRDARMAVGFSAMIALGMAGFGCSSTSSGGSGGATGSGGMATTGQGGAAGSGSGGRAASGGQPGGTDAGQDAPVSLAACSPVPADHDPCNANPACNKPCGVNITALTPTRALKTCTCSGPTSASGMWSCPSAAGACTYPTDVDLSCLRLPPTAVVCPKTTADGGTVDAGSGLIRPDVTPCETPQSETCGNVCGSPVATVFSYQDSNGMGKSGYCACISGKYQCASVNEWPFN